MMVGSIGGFLQWRSHRIEVGKKGSAISISLSPENQRVKEAIRDEEKGIPLSS
jgi:hypothetical protein